MLDLSSGQSSIFWLSSKITLLVQLREPWPQTQPWKETDKMGKYFWQRESWNGAHYARKICSPLTHVSVNLLCNIIVLKFSNVSNVFLNFIQYVVYCDHFIMYEIIKSLLCTWHEYNIVCQLYLNLKINQVKPPQHLPGYLPVSYIVCPLVCHGGCRVTFCLSPVSNPSSFT